MGFQEFTPRGTVFHYCSPSAFTGITDNKELWFSSLETSNDPRELKLGYVYLLRALKEVAESTETAQDREFFHAFYQQTLPWYSGTDVFCCCFTASRDALPMWGAYGSDYKGLSIGFRPTGLFDIPARIQKVKYIGPDTSSEFADVIREVMARMRVQSADWINQISAVVEPACKVFATKHNTWSYEEEIRLTHVQRRERPERCISDLIDVRRIGAFPDGTDVLWSEPLVRIAGSSAVRYKIFKFGRYAGGASDHRSAIKEVIIGPLCELSISDVERSLCAGGYRDVLVTKSRCMIRP